MMRIAFALEQVWIVPICVMAGGVSDGGDIMRTLKEVDALRDRLKAEGVPLPEAVRIIAAALLSRFLPDGQTDLSDGVT